MKDHRMKMCENRESEKSKHMQEMLDMHIKLNEKLMKTIEGQLKIIESQNIIIKNFTTNLHKAGEIENPISIRHDNVECEDYESEDDASESSNIYDTIINKLKDEKPNWYKTGKYISKTLVYENIIDLINRNIPKNVFWQNMREFLIEKEGQACKLGNRIRQIKLKKLWENVSSGEAKCMSILKKEFPNYKFIKCRPKWLINPNTGKPLELDMYNKNLKLAVEFNGKQHVQETHRFHKNKKDFENQVERDDIKLKICMKRGIELIVVNHGCDIEKYLKSKIKIFKRNNEIENTKESESEDDATKSSNIYDNIINRLKDEKPNWYKTGKYISKKLVYENIIKLIEEDIPRNVFWQKMRKHLIEKEKRANNNGSKQLQIKLKKLW